MNTPTHDFVTVEMRGLKAALVALAQSQRVDGGGRAGYLAALTMPTTELATLSRNLYQLCSLLRRGGAEFSLPYRSRLGTMAREERGHLDHASMALVALHPRCPSNIKPAGCNEPNTRRGHT